MKGLVHTRVVLAPALGLLMLLSLLVGASKGPVSAPYDFDAYLGAGISNSLIDGVIGPEWDDAGHYTGVEIDPWGDAEIWTKYNPPNWYIAMRFTADSNNPWVAFMPAPWASTWMGGDLDIFGDDNLDAHGYVDAWFESETTIHADTDTGGNQDGVGIMTVGEGNLITIELKKRLNSGDTAGKDIAWYPGVTYDLAIAWDSDEVGLGGPPAGGSSGGTASHKARVTTRKIYINPDLKPGVLSVTTTVNPSIVNSNETSTIRVQVADGVTPVSEANVTLSSDMCPTSCFSPYTGNTDSNGYFNSTFTAPNVSEPTTVKITATASKSGYLDGSDEVDLLVNPPGVPPLFVSVAANPTTIKSGESSTITVNVTDGVNPIPDATVILSSNNGGTFSPESGNTNSTGVFTSTFNASSVTQQTTYTITANATKEGYSGAPRQIQVTVEPTDDEPSEDGDEIELLWILVTVAVISIVVIAGALVARRQRRDRVYEKMRKLYEEYASAS